MEFQERHDRRSVGTTRLVGFRATKDEVIELKYLASKRGKTVSNYLRSLVIEDKKKIELEQLAKSVTEI